MSRLLHRELFETKRQLEYFSPKELSMQLGAEPSCWGVVLIKELVDNALDACETAGISPEISITLRPDGFTVKDNGPGMSQDLIQRSLNYDIRISDKTYYVSPSRGQLGNALKCVWAAPYAVDEESPGSVEVVSLGLQHRIAVTVNRIVQEPTLAHTLTEQPFVETGSSVTVMAPKVAYATMSGRLSKISTNRLNCSSRSILRSTLTPPLISKLPMDVSTRQRRH